MTAARLSLLLSAALLVTGCSSQKPLAPISSVSAPVSVHAKAAALVQRMTLERKIAQLIMPDISTITPQDVTTYRFGTILNGGNSGPGGNDQAPAPEWLKLADRMWDAAMLPHPDGQPTIPLLWATDAVHGHNNVPGATLFPHNIALGAARDPELTRKIGEATAAEIAVTGIDWTFAPTLAVTTDTRWGRTYESYGADTALVAELGSAMVEGLQGPRTTSQFLDERRVIATVKHFFGDGGTGGKDQGDTTGPLAELEAIHAAPYRPAIAKGAGSVMASFSSVNGVKMHGSRELLTGLLRGNLGFDGVVVGDWNGHGQIPGCTNSNCPQALLAGLDIYMVPEDWKALYSNLVAQARDGTIPMARVDEAATRVVSLKLLAGAFERGRPSDRALAGKWDILGAPEHRALAREAVRKSLVLLKNEGVLPIRANANVLVAGSAADSIPAQSGGWTITWQGGGELTKADFPGATSVYAGIAEAVRSSGGKASYSADGQTYRRPDVAIVVFGEPPYAEFMGDRLDHRLDDESGLKILRALRAKGIPTVAVLLSGRPLWTSREMALADAFVAGWLPGSEGGGVADVLIGDVVGRPRYDFSGKLPFAWPADCAAGSPALFPQDFGGKYGQPLPSAKLATRCAGSAGGTSLKLYGRGQATSVRLTASDQGGMAQLSSWKGMSPTGAVRVTPFDIAAQEDARTIEWTSPGILEISFGKVVPAKGSLQLRFAAIRAPSGPIILSAAKNSQGVDIASTLRLAADKGLRTARIPLACLSKDTLGGLSIRSDGTAAVRLTDMTITPEPGPSSCQGPF